MELLTTAEAANLAGVAVETVKRAVSRGTLTPAPSIAARGYRFTRAEVERWTRETNLKPGRRHHLAPSHS